MALTLRQLSDAIDDVAAELVEVSGRTSADNVGDALERLEDAEDRDAPDELADARDDVRAEIGAISEDLARGDAAMRRLADTWRAYRAAMRKEITDLRMAT